MDTPKAYSIIALASTILKYIQILIVQVKSFSSRIFQGTLNISEFSTISVAEKPFCFLSSHTHQEVHKGILCVYCLTVMRENRMPKVVNDRWISQKGAKVQETHNATDILLISPKASIRTTSTKERKLKAKWR